MVKTSCRLILCLGVMFVGHEGGFPLAVCGLVDCDGVRFRIEKLILGLMGKSSLLF